MKFMRNVLNEYELSDRTKQIFMRVSLQLSERVNCRGGFEVVEEVEEVEVRLANADLCNCSMSC